eukprot:scaffold110061_cov15-Prasinocladus_malaysianus.AAC.1
MTPACQLVIQWQLRQREIALHAMRKSVAVHYEIIKIWSQVLEQPPGTCSVETACKFPSASSRQTAKTDLPLLVLSSSS